MKRLIVLTFFALLSLIKLEAQSAHPSSGLMLGFSSYNGVMLELNMGRYEPYKLGKLNSAIYYGGGIGAGGLMYPYGYPDKINNVRLIPIFIEGRLRLFSSFISPVLALRLSAEHTTLSLNEPDYDYIKRHNLQGEKATEAKKEHRIYKTDRYLVPSISPSIGLRLRIWRHFAVNLRYSVTLRTVKTESVGYASEMLSLGFEL